MINANNNTCFETQVTIKYLIACSTEKLLFRNYSPILRLTEPIYLRVSYVFEAGFSAAMIQPISMIFVILNN